MRIGRIRKNSFSLCSDPDVAVEEEEYCEHALKTVIQCTSRLVTSPLPISIIYTFALQINVLLLEQASEGMTRWVRDGDLESELPESSVWDEERLYGVRVKRGKNVEDSWDDGEAGCWSILPNYHLISFKGKNELSEDVFDTTEPEPLEFFGPATIAVNVESRHFRNTVLFYLTLDLIWNKARL